MPAPTSARCAPAPNARADGSYRLTGTKIFITYGEHDLTDNIIHFVLARVTGAPSGTKGLSLFLVPKFLVKADGTLGERNDARAHSLEHKLGIHGSPTCVMVYGDRGGAVGYLVGEENRGMACMFTMMNEARLAVGLQGVAVAEAATQRALAYANERKQGRAPGMDPTASVPIIAHVDVRRMLITMRALTRAARTVCYATAVALDRAHRAADPAARKAGEERAALLTPVAKAFSTDIGSEVASLGIQVHGGMGFIEETGAAQHYRDARIAQIYEGTNGIQAIDLVTRKVPMAGGRGGDGLSRRASRDDRCGARGQRSRLRRHRAAARGGRRRARPCDALAARDARYQSGCGARRRDVVLAAIRHHRRRLHARRRSTGRVAPGRRRRRQTGPHRDRAVLCGEHRGPGAGACGNRDRGRRRRPQWNSGDRPPMSDNVIISDDGPIRVVRMNRLEKMNAITDDMYDKLAGALESAEHNKEIRCVVITGGKTVFSAGSDLNDFLHAAQHMEGLRPAVGRFLRGLVHTEKPVVAGVQGVAIGIGMTMLLHFDFVVAATNARFSAPFAKLGVVPEAGSSLLAPRLMGTRRAFALLVMGRPIDAQEAKSVGLVNVVVPPGQGRRGGHERGAGDRGLAAGGGRDLAASDPRPAGRGHEAHHRGGRHLPRADAHAGSPRRVRAVSRPQALRPAPRPRA